MKFWYLFLVSAKQRNVYLFDVLSSLFSYSIRIFLIVTLFRYLQAANPGAFGAMTIKELGWGLVFAQIATVGIPNICWEVAEDVKSGKLAVYLLNPVSYPLFKAFEVISGAFMRMAALTVIALGIGAAFVGIPDSITFASVAGSLVLLVGAYAIFTLIHLVIGLFAFVFEEVSPIRWIVWKFNLLLGGNILPISFFPSWLQTVAFASPFAYTGYTAGLVFAHFDAADFTRYLGMQALWIGLLSASVFLSYSYFSRRLVTNGG